jgi:hypothetical protein
VAQFITLRFIANAEGQERKVKSLNWLGSNGWRIMGETIEPGHIQGKDACCLAMICLPLGFAAGRTPNVTVVTMQRDEPEVFAHLPADGHEHAFYYRDDNTNLCDQCGATQPRYAAGEPL